MRLLSSLLKAAVLAAAGLLVVLVGPVQAVTTVHVSAPSDQSPVSRAATAASWTVELDQAHVSSTIGDHFAFVSTLHNEADASRPATIAYLNVLSTRPDVYVDPEDWSAQRTRFLGDVRPGATSDVTWSLQAVNSGEFVVFVVVTSAAGGDEVVTSPALRVTIANERRLNPTGILPVVVVVPGVVAVTLGWSRRRRRLLR